MPLLHAWAITVHKSQGMSISKLVVTLGRAFAAGQVYVALSRCTSRDGLQVRVRALACMGVHRGPGVCNRGCVAHCVLQVLHTVHTRFALWCGSAVQPGTGSWWLLHPTESCIRDVSIMLPCWGPVLLCGADHRGCAGAHHRQRREALLPVHLLTGPPVRHWGVREGCTCRVPQQAGCAVRQQAGLVWTSRVAVPALGMLRSVHCHPEDRWCKVCTVVIMFQPAWLGTTAGRRRWSCTHGCEA